MIKEEYRNNHVTVLGKIVSDFQFSHEAYGEKFYTVDVAIRRLSDNVDCIPVMKSGELADTSKNLTGQSIYVDGQFRSYNQYDGNKNHLKLNVLAKKWRQMEWDDIAGNTIFLDGYVCRVPVYRTMS